MKNKPSIFKDGNSVIYGGPDLHLGGMEGIRLSGRTWKTLAIGLAVLVVFQGVIIWILGKH